MSFMLKAFILFFVCVKIISYFNPLSFSLFFLNEFLIAFTLVVLPLFSVIAIIFNRYLGIIYLLIVFLFSPYYTSFFSFNSRDTTDSSSIEVMSFNASYFRAYSKSLADYRSAEKKVISAGMVEWVNEFEGDLICFQEYYYDKNVPTFTTTDQLTKSGFFYHYVSSNSEKSGFYNRSLAIFSRHPIINQAEIFVDQNLYNRGIYTDIVINDDTVRVINIHLHSNELNKQKSILSILKKYLWNSKVRYTQAMNVKEVILNTKYPIILCGDFNQTVFSPVYQLFNSVLNNSFEEKGNGLGATLNSEKLSFLRIDQQFCSDHFEVVSHHVNREMKSSHHFPITASYALKE